MVWTVKLAVVVYLCFANIIVLLDKVREIEGLLHDQVVSTGLLFILAGIIQKVVEEIVILILLLLI